MADDNVLGDFTARNDKFLRALDDMERAVERSGRRMRTSGSFDIPVRIRSEQVEADLRKMRRQFDIGDDSFLRTGTPSRGSSRGSGRTPGGSFNNQNPFSVEGFGRLTGSIAAVAAADRLLKAGSGLIEGARLRASPDQLTRIQGFEAQKQAVESIPIVGRLIEFVDALTGASAELKRWQQAIQAAAEARQAATRVEDSIASRKAALSGDPFAVARNAQQAELKGIDKELANLDKQRETVGTVDARFELLGARANLEIQQRQELKALQAQEAFQKREIDRQVRIAQFRNQISTAKDGAEERQIRGFIEDVELEGKQDARRTGERNPRLRPQLEIIEKNEREALADQRTTDAARLAERIAGVVDDYFDKIEEELAREEERSAEAVDRFFGAVESAAARDAERAADLRGQSTETDLRTTGKPGEAAVHRIERELTAALNDAGENIDLREALVANADAQLRALLPSDSPASVAAVVANVGLTNFGAGGDDPAKESNEHLKDLVDQAKETNRLLQNPPPARTS